MSDPCCSRACFWLAVMLSPPLLVTVILGIGRLLG